MQMIIRGVIVCAVLTPAVYNTYVKDFFLTTLPDWIASSVGQGQVASQDQFDALISAVKHRTALIMAEATGITNIGRVAVIWFAGQCAEICIFGCFCIWFFAMAMQNLVVCLGPFVIAGYLFKATKGITERWIGKMIGMCILQLLIAILMQVVMTQDSEYMRQVQNNPGAGLDEQISALWDVAKAFGVGLALVIMLPAIAAYIGGGISFSPTQAVTLALRAGRR
jgi:type IV secretion system protein VirB6